MAITQNVQHRYAEKEEYTGTRPLIGQAVKAVANGGVSKVELCDDATADGPLFVGVVVGTSSDEIDSGFVDVAHSGSAQRRIRVKAGGAITLHANLTTDASGDFIVTTTSNDYILAIALEAGSDGDLVMAEVRPRGILGQVA